SDLGEQRSNMSKPVVARIRPDLKSVWSDDLRGDLSFFKLFSGDVTATDTMSVGIAELDPRGGVLRPHRHAEPEVYFIIEGTGVVTLGVEEKVSSTGEAVFIPGNHRHGIRNDSDHALRLLYILAADRLEDVEYRFEEE